MKAKRFLCYQLIVSREEIINGKNETFIDNVIRNVGARNKEEALGKFILMTNKMDAVKRLEPECFELSQLFCID